MRQISSQLLLKNIGLVCVFLLISQSAQAQFFKCKKKKNKQAIAQSINAEVVCNNRILPKTFNSISYVNEVHKIDSLFNINQIKTAAPLIANLKLQSKKDNQTGYWIKSIRYELLLLNNSEDNGIKQWQIFQSAFQETDEIGKMLLSIEMADYLRTHFVYKSYNEEKIVNDSSANPGEWSSVKLFTDINAYISYSIQTAKKYCNGNYLDPLIDDRIQNSIKLEVEDIISLKAIEILKQVTIPSVAQYESPDKVLAISNWDIFSKQNYNVSKDPKNEYRILDLYQSILSNSYSIYFDLERLKYVKEHYSLNDKYYELLDTMWEKHKNENYGKIIALEIIYKNIRLNSVKSMKVIEQALLNEKDSYLNNQLNVIKRTILKPSFSIQTESVYPANKKILALANSKNIDQIYVNVYKIDDFNKYFSLFDIYRHESTADKIKYIKQLKHVRSTEIITLPKYFDYTEKNIEFSIEQLPYGTYLIVCSNNSNFEDSASIIQCQSIHISKYSILKNDDELILMQADNGSIASNVDYTVSKVSNRWEDNIKINKVYSGKTNSDGEINLSELKKGNQEYLIELDSGTLYFNSDHNYSDGFEKEETFAVKILTDRSIYRPGQTVFYKCIAYNTYSSKTLSAIKLKLTLEDNNSDIKDSINLTTNAYGSLSGKFVLPKSGFNTGTFYIRSNLYNGYAYFQVEEYKRPKYKVVIQKPDSAYSLNSMVSLSGKAEALAGYSIQGAEVTYTVTRYRNLRYYWWSRGYMGSENKQVIVSKSTVTDANGNFTINFKAIPDALVPESENPYFRFVVEAKVTDVNGEVRTTNFEMELAYTDRVFELSGETQYPLGKSLKLNFLSKNLQGNTLSFTGKIVLKKILTENTIFKNRYWDKPDTSAISQEEYVKYFPEYASNKKQELYKEISSKYFSQDTIGIWEIEKNTIQEPGEYIATMYGKDSRGKEFISEFKFSVESQIAGPISNDSKIKIYTLGKSSYEPGETLKVLIGSAAKGSTIYFKAVSKRGTIYEKTISVNQNTSMIEIPVKEGDRGNIYLHAHMVYQYRLYEETHTAIVPYSNKKLDIRLSSFRSDIEPGSKEKWIITLKGPKSEKAAMEMLALMYDQSLDELYPRSDLNINMHYDFYNWLNISSSLLEKSFSNIRNNNYDEIFEIFNFSYPRYKEYYYNSSDGREYQMYYDVQLGNVTLIRGKSGSIEQSKEMNLSAGLNFHNDDYDGIEDKKAILVPANSNPPSIRKNFDETAFFFPHLYANAKGEIQIEFTMPDALTQWKIQMLAHSTTMQLGYAENSVTSSKKIMLQPNMPRFLRQGDKISLSSKIVNTTNKAIQVQVNCNIKNDMDGNTLNWLTEKNSKSILVPAKGVATCTFAMHIPDYTGAVTISLNADAAGYSDGEEHTLLVLSNRSLITKTLPITIRNAGTQNLEFKALKEDTSSTLKHHQYSVEMSANPAWYAIQSLPYMMEFPNECAEQIFTRLYANSIATHLANSNPTIKKVYQEWQRAYQSGSGTLQSKLMENQDLRLTLIEETPWLREARNETERMRNLGRLFDTQKMDEELQISFDKLLQLQMENGAWSWFKGMYPNIYITQTIVIGFGKMQKMGIDISAYLPMITKAIEYLDIEVERNYKIRIDKSLPFNPYQVDLQYLYCKSYFPAIGNTKHHIVLRDFMLNVEKNFISYSLLNQAQIATAIHILDPKSTLPGLILRAFNETAIQNTEMGMYWPKNNGGIYWYESAIETQSAIIEMYSVMGQAYSTIQEQQIWLLRQKQTQSWSSTRSTADACYALLSNGKLLDSKNSIQVQVAEVKVVPEKVESGSGYFRQNLPKENINKQFSNITVQSDNSGFAYGAIYWQYFENNDKVTASGSGLQITKRLFKVVNTAVGTERIEVKLGDIIRVGDIIEVVLQISTDRNLEYVHVKDLRASGVEPVNVISSYFWKNGLSYYMSTKDASTNYFIDYLSKGNYQLNYTIKVEQVGVFDCGFASVQCMYAPEFTANSISLILKVQ